MLNAHEFEQTPGDSEGQGRLACCSPWGCKDSDMTERLTEKQYFKVLGVQVLNTNAQFTFGEGTPV